MNKINAGGPAFPLPVEDLQCRSRFESGYGGMTLRDRFAGLAMQGLLAAQIYGFNDRPSKGPFASMAYEMATPCSPRENRERAMTDHYEKIRTALDMDTGLEYKSVGEQEASFACKYCGQPSWIDPSDQSPPPDYCHEIDHGTAEDRTGS